MWLVYSPAYLFAILGAGHGFCRSPAPGRIMCSAISLRLLFAARRDSCTESVAYKANRIDKSTAFTSLVNVPSEM